MGLMDFFKAKNNANELKASASQHVIMTGTSGAVWSKRNFAQFAKEGYSQNVVAFQCVNKIAEAVASVGWEAWRGDTQLTEHRLLELIKQPNPNQSGQEFFADFVGYLMIAGNSYTEKVKIGSEPRELYSQRPDRMKLNVAKSGSLSGYTYTVNATAYTWPVDATTQQSDILHTKLFNPLDDWYGQSPMEAGAFAIDQHNESMNWMQALLQNSARPSGALVMSENKDLTDPQFERLKTQIEASHTGAGNAGRPMLLEGGLDWKEMGMSPVAMGHLETKNSSARDIALAFGVPPMLLGIRGDNTYANYSEARLSFWEDTVLPLVTHIAGDLNGWFKDDFEGVTLVPKLSEIPAIVDKRMTLWGMADASNDLTINEKRKLKGFEPIEGGDQLLVTGAMIPLSETSLTTDDLTKAEGQELETMIKAAYGEG